MPCLWAQAHVEGRRSWKQEGISPVSEKQNFHRKPQWTFTYIQLARMYHVTLSRPGFLSLSPTNIGGQITLSCGGPACALQDVYLQPWPLPTHAASTPTPVVTIKNVCRHCQMSPGGHNHPWLRTTLMLITTPQAKMNKGVMNGAVRQPTEPAAKALYLFLKCFQMSSLTTMLSILENWGETYKVPPHLRSTNNKI